MVQSQTNHAEEMTAGGVGVGVGASEEEEEVEAGEGAVEGGAAGAHDARSMHELLFNISTW